MTDLIEDYLRQVAASLPDDPERRRQIVDELRSHLSEKVADLERQDPSRLREEIERQVLNEFGSPQELAQAYAPRAEGTRQSIVETALDVGRRALGAGKAAGQGVLTFAGSMGRGARRVLRGLAITFLVLLLVAGGLGVWAWYEVRPYLPALMEQEEPAYRYDGWCVSCHAPVDDVFYVPEGARHVRFQLDMVVKPPWVRSVVSHDLQTGASYLGADRLLHHNGTAQVVVKNPEGDVMLSRSFPLNLTNVAGTTQRDHLPLYDGRWAATPGNWSVQMTFDNFPGTVHARAYARLVEWYDIV